MKQHYEQPELEVTRFKVEDIVTDSSLDNNELPPYGNP